MASDSAGRRGRIKKKGHGGRVYSFKSRCGEIRVHVTNFIISNRPEYSSMDGEKKNRVKNSRKRHARSFTRSIHTSRTTRKICVRTSVVYKTRWKIEKPICQYDDIWIRIGTFRKELVSENLKKKTQQTDFLKFNNFFIFLF